MADALVAVVLVAQRSFADFILRERVSYVQVHVALGLADTHHDALQIFLLALDISACMALDDGFAGFHDVAGFVFVGNAQRNNVHLHEILHEILGPAHVHHLQKALLGDVYAVFGAPLALGNPDRCGAGSNGFPDVFGQYLG